MSKVNLVKSHTNEWGFANEKMAFSNDVEKFMDAHGEEICSALERIGFTFDEEGFFTSRGTYWHRKWIALLVALLFDEHHEKHPAVSKEKYALLMLKNNQLKIVASFYDILCLQVASIRIPWLTELPSKEVLMEGVKEYKKLPKRELPQIGTLQYPEIFFTDQYIEFEEPRKK